ncbi:MAG: glucose 1-dehydrogenase [Gemmatales bacterium]|nr:glucose 1-dehydrogenase [Gemmatales bacterium]MDW7995495.1 glucose 1-dehydrogenase [Gemmatales bacterium]
MQAERVALVTGSATGIGRAVALKLAQQGYAIAVNYSRSHQEAEDTLQQVEKLGVPGLLIRANVARDDEVCRMVDQIVQTWKRIDVLVNNAGTTRFIDHRRLDLLTEEVWDEIFGVNLKGAFYCCRAVIPYMQQQGSGAIVNISSVAGILGIGSSIPYAASKGALNTLTKSLARAFAPQIRVNAVAPGPVLTRWLADHMDHIERQMALTPMQRAATPEDIADVVCFLVSGTHYITGQIIVVDGGRTM